MQRKKRRFNTPLMQVLLISLALHFVVGLILGGRVIYRSINEPTPEFEAPPPVPMETTQPRQQEVQVRMQQQQRTSLRPRQSLTVQSASAINVPEVTVEVPVINTQIGMAGIGGGGGGGAGLGSEFGKGGIGFEKSSVDFFGIRSQGERVVFILDTSRYMLEDRKGGLNAYRIVKEEITRMVNELSPATLFNVILYEYSNRLNTFRPALVPASAANKEAFARWIAPVNADASKTGARGNNYRLQASVDPIGSGIQFHYRAIQAAMEMNTDAIFLIGDRWQNRMRLPLPEGFDVHEWRRKEHGWNDEKQKAWDAAVARAQRWVERENERRRKAGQPPFVYQWIWRVVRENLKDNTPAPPNAPYEYVEFRGLLNHFRLLGNQLYPGQNERAPEVNVIIFRGKDEPLTRDQENEVRDFVRRNRGTHRVLQGLEAIQATTPVPEA